MLSWWHAARTAEWRVYVISKVTNQMLMSYELGDR
jgi:hypothetical protein